MKCKSSKSEVKWSEVKCREGGKNETLWEKFIWAVKWWEVKGWGESVSKVCVGGKILETVWKLLFDTNSNFHSAHSLRCSSTRPQPTTAYTPSAEHRMQ